MPTNEMINLIVKIGDGEIFTLSGENGAESFLISVVGPAVAKRCAKLRNIGQSALAVRLRIEYYNTLYALGLQERALQYAKDKGQG